MALLAQGSIVKAWVTPLRGKRKFRPVVVYTPTELIPQRPRLDVIGISGSYYPADDCIPLPWRADGRVPTRLTKPCAIVFNLLGTADKNEIEITGGYVTDAVLVELIERLKRMGKPVR